MTAPTDDRYSAPAAPPDGAYGEAYSGEYPPPPPAPQGHAFTIAGVVCATVGIAFLPIVFGLLGIVLGFVGAGRGERYGKWAGLYAIVATIAGLVLGYLVAKNLRS